MGMFKICDVTLGDPHSNNHIFMMLLINGLKVYMVTERVGWATRDYQEELCDAPEQVLTNITNGR